MTHDYFSNAFTEGQSIPTSFDGATLKIRHIGDLIITSGLLVACDPLTIANARPFTTPVPVGQHQVILSVALFAGGDQRVAFAKLKFGNAISVQWEMALTEGLKIESLKEGEFFGYPVDSGTGCFIDESSVSFLSNITSDQKNLDGLISAMQKNYVDTWDWLDLCLDPSNGANVITFSSGLGDGFYPSFFGYDRNGDVSELITDFGLFYENEMET